MGLEVQGRETRRSGVGGIKASIIASKEVGGGGGRGGRWR